MNFKVLTILTVSTLLTINVSNAKTFRQSNGKGNFSLNLAYENYEIDNEQTKATAGPSVESFNNTYNSPVERDILMLKGSYGLLDSLDIFAGVGYTYEKWNAERKSTGIDEEKQTGQDPIFELGVKGTAFKFLDNKLYISYLLKYSYLDTGDKYVGVSVNPSKSEATWNEYSADIELGYNIEKYQLTPYLGASYMDLEVKQKLDGSYWKYENEDDFSFFAGLNKEINDTMSLNLEGTLGAKEGFSLGLDYNF